MASDKTGNSGLFDQKKKEPDAAAKGAARIIEGAINQHKEDENKRRLEAEEDAKVWDSDNPNRVINHQPATVIHENCHGQVVIIQEAESYGVWDRDPYVIIEPAHLGVVIERLKTLQKELAGRS